MRFPDASTAHAQSGALTIAQYAELLNSRSDQDKALAIALKAANRTQEAMRVMKRIKLMQEETQEIDAGAGAG